MSDKLACQECSAQTTPLPMRDRDGKHVCISCFLTEKHEPPAILEHYRALLKRQEQARQNFQHGRKMLS